MIYYHRFELQLTHKNKYRNLTVHTVIFNKNYKKIKNYKKLRKKLQKMLKKLKILR